MGTGWPPSFLARICAAGGIPSGCACPPPSPVRPGFTTTRPWNSRLVADGVLIRPVQPRLSLAERLAAYTPMEGEAIEAMAWDPIGTEVIE